MKIRIDTPLQNQCVLSSDFTKAFDRVKYLIQILRKMKFALLLVDMLENLYGFLALTYDCDVVVVDYLAACNGGAVEWMQCTREERELWERVRSSPHHWVQGHLRLRSNFAPFK